MARGTISTMRQAMTHANLGLSMKKVVPVFLIALGFGSTVPAAGASGTTSLCSVAPSWTSNKCFGPARAWVAEARMPISPVRPSRAVVRRTHLTLSRVMLIGVARPSGIEYLFGWIPRDLHGLPSLQLSTPRYMLVTEIVGHNAALTGRVVYTGTWAFAANFRCRRLTLTVESNISAIAVRKTGEITLRTEGCGH